MTISGKRSHAGLVLAAGASTRMGSPKALLENTHGVLLADAQADVLHNSGCRSVLVVLGSQGEAILSRLRHPTTLNTAWESGRVSSVQAGLRKLPGFDGYFILPVDAIGINVETVFVLRQYADARNPEALRPVFRGQKGHLLWISPAVAQIVLQAKVHPESRLDELVAPYVQELDVGDGAVLNNVNTPDEWNRLKE